MCSLVSFAGCNLPGVSQPPTADPILIYTQAAQTVSAQLTALSTTVPPVTTPLLPVDTTVATASPTQEPTPTSQASPTPTATPTLIPTPAVELVFEDDFSKDRHWYEEKNPDFGFELEDGGYHIYVNILNAAVWSVRELSLSNVILEVDAARVSGSKSGYFGLTCRHKGEDDYYALVVGSDGFYGVARMLAGEFEFLEEGMDETGIIRSGEAGNRLRAECIGERLSLFVNGQKLIEAQDDQLDAGEVGLLAGTRMDGGIEVRFDNFAIYKP